MFTLRTKRISLAMLLILCIGIISPACAAPMSATAPAPMEIPMAQEKASAPRPAAGFVAEREAISADEADASSAQASERLVVKNANLTVVVVDPPKSMETISALANEMDGYVVSANLYETQLESGVKVPRASITIRVPAEQLDEVLKRIKAESDRLPLSENISSQDVTAEYTDQKSRLKNLEAAEKQLTAIMEDARKTEDVLSVYNQLVQIREQIEVTKGQIKYYEQSAALSAISVELVANEAVQPLTIGSWQPVGVAKDAVQALINTMKFLANALIWIVIFVVPVLAVLYLVIFLPLRMLWRTIRRGRKSKKEAPAATQPPESK